MITYQVKKEILYHTETGFYTTFGIDAVRTISNHTILIHSISDVFLEQADAEEFVQICNDEELSPLHLHDAIENALS